jgi:selenocysteine lyase/cysteine desulfurase
MRFAGATMDFTALYRLRAVLRMFGENGIDVATVNEYVMSMQRTFLEKLAACNHPLLNEKHLAVSNEENRGHFLTFELDNADVTKALASELKEHHILTDFRGNRLRFGFGLYHTPEYIDLSALIQKA